MEKFSKRKGGHAQEVIKGRPLTGANKVNRQMPGVKNHAHDSLDSASLGTDGPRRQLLYQSIVLFAAEVDTSA